MLLRICSVLCYALLGVLVLAFIFSNRAVVTVDLFPLGASAELPLYLLLSLLFFAGLAIGLLHSMRIWLTMRRKLRRAERSIGELEKELISRPSA